jgi:hypothetical protein
MPIMPDGSVQIQRVNQGANGDIAIRNALNRAYDERRPDPSDAELARIGDEADTVATFGFDYKKDKHGMPIQQGVGAAGNENVNHFNAIRRYEGADAYWRAVREIKLRDPARHKALGLPEPPRVGA